MLIIKIIDKNTKREKIHKVESLPCTIGRSIKNTIIIEDDSISALHAVINTDSNGIYLKDIKSTNGISVNDVNIDQHYIHENTTCTFGVVDVDIIFDEEILEETRVIDIPEELFKRSSNDKKRNTIISMLVISLFIFINQYLSAPLRKEDIPEFVSELFTSYCILGGFSLLSAVISKVHSKKYKLMSFFETFSILIAVFYIYDLLDSYVSFYSNSRVFSSLLEFIFLTVVLCFSSFTILTIFFRSQHKKTIYFFIGTCYFGFIMFFYISTIFNEKDLKFKFISSFEYSPFSYKKSDYPFKTIKSKITKSFEELDEFRIKKNDQQAIELDEYQNANP